MNDKMILKLLKPLINEDKINDFCEYLTEKAKEFIADQKHDPEQFSIIGLAYMDDETETIKIGAGVVNQDLHIVRIFHAQELNTFANNLLKQL